VKGKGPLSGGTGEDPLMLGERDGGEEAWGEKKLWLLCILSILAGGKDWERKEPVGVVHLLPDLG